MSDTQRGDNTDKNEADEIAARFPKPEEVDIHVYA